MKALKFVSLLALAISVVGGCILVSGQFIIDWQLDPITVSQDALQAYQIDLNEESAYKDHKDGLQGLADLAVVGLVGNNLSEATQVTVFITPQITSFGTRSELNASNQATRLWGDFSLPADGQVRIDWDTSAGLFDDAGMDVLIQEMLGDGNFTLYVLATTSTFDVFFNDGWLILIVDAQD